MIMEKHEKKSILIASGNSKLLESLQEPLKDLGVTIYVTRSSFEAAKILFSKQVDSVLVLGGLSHIIDSIRLFSTVPCTCVVCDNCATPGGADFVIQQEDFDIAHLPEYLERMVQLNEMRTRFSGIVWFNRLRIDIDNYTVEYNDKSFKLKPLEIKLLFYLSKNLNRVISRQRLLSAVWGYEQAGATRTLDVHIMSLRALLNNNHIPLEIQTFRGEGYKLYDTETSGGAEYFS